MRTPFISVMITPQRGPEDPYIKAQVAWGWLRDGILPMEVVENIELNDMLCPRIRDDEDRDFAVAAVTALSNNFAQWVAEEPPFDPEAAAAADTPAIAPE